MDVTWHVHTREHAPREIPSRGRGSCFAECETQSAAGRKANFRLQRREHLSVFHCHSALGWMESAALRHSEPGCVCVSVPHVDASVCVSFLLTCIVLPLPLIHFVLEAHIAPFTQQAILSGQT